MTSFFARIFQKDFQFILFKIHKFSYSHIRLISNTVSVATSRKTKRPIKRFSYLIGHFDVSYNFRRIHSTAV